MKYKKILSVAFVLLIAGLVCMLAASMLVGFNWEKLNSEEFTEYSRTFDGKYNEIEIIDANVKVELIPTDDKMKLVYYESDDTKYTISDEGSKLYIKKNERIKFFWFSFDIFSPDKLTLYIPADYVGDIKVSNSNGSINAEGFDFAEADLGTINARINVIGCSFGKLKLSSMNGGITMNSCNADKADISTTNSSIDIENVTITSGALDISNLNGTIRITNTNANSLTAKTSNASVILNNVNIIDYVEAKSSNGNINIDTLIAKKLFAKTSNSKVLVNAVDCLEVELKSSNGSISGTLVGRMENYSIKSSTSNGSTNLPNGTTSGSRKLITSTSNADIDIYFDNTDGCF
ncbi:MAG: DUF4097 domain-containing protein [Clostridiales bacterium]|nr:DUF4097 domain-containing protein [Clostridiales bacterium]